MWQIIVKRRKRGKLWKIKTMKLFSKAKPNNEFELIIDEVKRLSEKEAISFSFNEKKDISPVKSKLGGVPYGEYPEDSKGEKMLFLIQLNLSDIPFETALPEKGLIQLFVSADGSSECKVVYYEIFDEESTDVFEASGEFCPVLRECEISFEKGADYICVNDNDFNNVLSKAVKTVSGRDMQGDMFDFFSEEECETLCREFTAKGSKLFGNPCFTQCDVRDEESGEILLLQLDSDGENIMWGDYGTGNFFIKEESLKALDFSDVIYNWDCD